jgi:protoporphyrinogen IX oxidase
MLWIKAFHIIAMVAWFAGLFYLPRLFVYHAEAVDEVSLKRFNIMERRLYFGIMWPAAILTTGLGLVLLSANSAYYLHAHWMHAKLGLVLLLWAYHLACGHYLRGFRLDANKRSALFYRVWNEIPTVLLIGVVLLVVVR